MEKRYTLELAALEDRVVMDATALDLTARGSDGWVNGAYFAQTDAQPTGTGHIQSFLRIQGASAKGVTQQGYNTAARPLQFDENTSPQFTRALKASEVPTVNVGGQMYKEFLLDINQKGSQPLLSLDQVRLYTDAAGNLHGYDPATKALAGTTLVYDMDGGGDSWVKLDYRLNSGSGSGDMLMYVPASAFGAGDYVYLYSKFGEHFAANAGFQEWARGTGGSLTQNTGSISGTVFADDDANASYDGTEGGLGGRMVFLDTNGNGVVDTNEVYTFTDSNGGYTFTGLMGNQTYTVRLVTGDTESLSTTLGSVSLAPDQDLFNVDFGVITPRNPT